MYHRHVVRFSNPGVLIVMLWANLPPLVGIGLTQLPNSGGAKAPPLTTALQYIFLLNQNLACDVFDFCVFTWIYLIWTLNGSKYKNRTILGSDQVNSGKINKQLQAKFGLIEKKSCLALIKLYVIHLFPKSESQTKYQGKFMSCHNKRCME